MRTSRNTLPGRSTPAGLRLALLLILGLGSAAFAADTDGDGLDDSVETNTGIWVSASDTGTNPAVKDSDGDGLWDGEENNSGTFVSFVSSSNANTGTNPNVADTDGDGLNDGNEAQSNVSGSQVAFRTNPNLADTDGDNLNDKEEGEGAGSRPQTEPNNADTDGDGLQDDVETHTGTFVSAADTGTDPTDSDTDNDNLTDGEEVNGKNVTVNPEADTAETINYTSNPLLPDTDGDNVDDGQEVNGISFSIGNEGGGAEQFVIRSSNPNVSDTDGDGLFDDFEILNNLNAFDDGTDILGTAAVDDGDSVNGATGNPDRDDNDNLAEQTAGTDPNLFNPPPADPGIENPDNSAGLSGTVFAQAIGGEQKRVDNRSIAIGVDNSVYLSGGYRGTIEFETSSGDPIQLTDPSGDQSYLAAQMPSGLYLWAKKITASSTVAVRSVATSGGYVYVGGMYRGSSLVYDGTATSLPAASSAVAGFVLKINSSTGALSWAKGNTNRAADSSSGNRDKFVAGTSRVNDIAIHEGNVYVCGSFTGKIGLFGANVSPRNVGKNNESDVFVAKLNSSGNRVWSNTGGGPRGSTDEFSGDESDSTLDEAAYGIAVDSHGDAYICGRMLGKYKSGVIALPGRFVSYVDNNKTSLYTGDDEGDGIWSGVPSWFVAKFDDSDSGRNLFLDGERDNWNNNGSHQHAYSQANDIAVIDGFVYVVGKHDGWLQESSILHHIRGTRGNDFVPDMGTTAGTTDGWIMKLDTNLELQDYEGVRGSGNDSIERIVGDIEGNVYVSGLFGEASARFTREDEATDSTKQLTTVNGQNLFLAGLTGGLNWNWASPPSSDAAPPNQLFSAGIALNNGNTRLYSTGWWGGTGQTFRVGSGGAAVDFTAGTGTSSFLYAVTPDDGVFLEQITLEIRSPVAGVHVNPGVGIFTVFKGERVTATVPARIYDDPTPGETAITGDETFDNLEDDDGTIDDVYVTRHTSTGYTIGDGITSDEGTRFEGVITEDTILEFNWDTEYVLEVTSDLEQTGSTRVGNAFEVGGDGLGLTSTASGNPQPEVRRHWILEGEIVTAFVDGSVIDFKNIGTRYVVTGWDSTGQVTPTAGFNGIEPRQQIPEFEMSGPGTLEYQWKIQHRIQTSTSNSSAEDLPRVRLGSFATTLNPDDAGYGSGEHWYDRGSSVFIGSLRGGAGLGTKELTGWLNASAPPFPLAESQNSLDGLLFTGSGANTFYYLGVTSLTRPVTIAWNYSDNIYHASTDLGAITDILNAEDFSLSLLKDSAPNLAEIESSPGTIRAPDRVRIVESPPGTNGPDMQAWDELADRSLPLRPGTFFMEWDKNGTDDKVIVEVTSQFPVDPHFKHLYFPDIPNVDVDPDPADEVAFISLAYSNGDATVTEGSFKSSLNGKSVLLFGRSDTPESPGGIATGDNSRDTLQVRVVETIEWNESLVDAESNAPIASPLPTLIDTVEYDTAGIGTGFVVYPNARYNANIYDRTKVADAGPVIPVNRHYEEDDANGTNPNDLFVFWYDRGNNILWPTTSVGYNAVWPNVVLGGSQNLPEVDADHLRRIVIASRLGSESKDLSFRDQLSFSADRFSNVAIYNQPRRDRPGFNPNEEHAVIAPSFKFLDQANPPPTAYALRRDLNVRNADSSYTSDPYTLVEYFDSEAGDNGSFRMAIYFIQHEDPSVPLDPPDANDRTFPYIFDYDMVAGEPVQPPYPLGRVIGLTPCEQTFGFSLGPQRTYWEDVNGQPWAVSDGALASHFYYPQALDFWNGEGESAVPPGTCIPFVVAGSVEGSVTGSTVNPTFENPSEFQYLDQTITIIGTNAAAFVNNFNAAVESLPANERPSASQTGGVITLVPPSSTGRLVLNDGPGLPLRAAGISYLNPGVTFTAHWPDNPPVLKAGETLTYQGGEWKADFPDAPGLPGVIGWAAGTVVYDSLNPEMDNMTDEYTARMIAPLETLTVPLNLSSTERANISPATGVTRVDRTVWRFTGLSASLQKRIFYDPLDGTLGIEGFVNDKTLGDNSLTAAPAPVYVLEPNILTAAEKTELLGLDVLKDFSNWTGATGAVSTLHEKGRDPNNLRPDDGFFAGLIQDTLSGGGFVSKDIQASGGSGLDDKYFLLYHPDNPVWVYFDIDTDEGTWIVDTVNSDGLDAGDPSWTDDEWVGADDEVTYEVVFIDGSLKGERFEIVSNDDDDLDLNMEDHDSKSMEDLGLDDGDQFVIVAKGARADNFTPDSIAGGFPSIQVDVQSGYSFIAVGNSVRSAINGYGNGYSADTDGTNGLVTVIYNDGTNDLPVAPRDANTGFSFPKSENPNVSSDTPIDGTAVPGTFLGPGLALVPSPDVLDPTSGFNEGYITIVENNDEDIGGPISLFVIKIEKEHRYRGAIKTILSDNVFDEKITLRHTGDFGANTDDMVYQWFYREEDGTDGVSLPPSAAWKIFPDQGPNPQKGLGQFQVSLEGTGGLLLADNLFFVRYRHKNDIPREANGSLPSPMPNPPVYNGVEWGPKDSDADNEEAAITYLDWWIDGVPLEGEVVGELFAGAGNSPSVDGDYKPQLVPGWIKRVLDRVNPYEARFNDFRNNEVPATYVSMIQQTGPPYVGPVALNPDKNVIENVGLLELYHTILDRGTGLSIDLSSPITTPGITNALLLASSRLSDLYMLLGNEAYSDAQDPTVGFGSTSADYGYASPSIYAFQNQMGSLLDEELSLLRGVDESFARPVFNRLFWNFTKSDGEVAYALNYNITDQNVDGFIDESDAMILYPQGHGDAWGHYLSALRGQYTLLKHPFFNWVSRSEQYNLLDIVIEVDFEDERKFANAAAAKAQAGAEVVDQTYRARYVANPDGQWQGYTDPSEDRSWGVQGWARRAGQGALFDWVTANAVLPSHDSKNTDVVNEALKKIDRTTVTALGKISANHGKIQSTYDDANNGLNPLGLASDVVPFDIDPNFDIVSSENQGEGHFEQIYQRAQSAAQNALAVFDHANEQQNRMRQQQVTADDFFEETLEQDRDFRNELIQIFGTPYAGTIGPGLPYPSGYNGPDLMLYMYVDVNEFSDRTVPQGSGTFAAAYSSFTSAISAIDGDFQDVDFPYFVNDVLSPGDIDEPALNSLIATGAIDDEGNFFANVPVTADDYTFQAPSEWGRRASPGELQGIVAELLQAEADYALAHGDYDNYVKELVDMAELLEARYGLAAETLSLRTANLEEIESLGDSIIIFTTIASGLDIISSFTEDFTLAGEDAAAQVVGFSNSFHIAGSIARGIFAAVDVILRAGQLAAEAAAQGNELKIGEVSLQLDIDIAQREDAFEIREKIKEIEQHLRNEGTTRYELFKRLEALREVSDRYRTTLQEGIVLLDAREDFNKLSATATQKVRYQDMAFRTFRNEALSKYRDSFDLAARYAYLAAKAYDYDTNLSPDDPASALGLLDDVIKARHLGGWSDGEPRHGSGLAGVLALMRDNFAVHKTQLGLNNFQQEVNKMSLREGHFRNKKNADNNTPGAALSNSLWRQELSNGRVANLWDIPEFRRFCRAPQAESAGALPGIVLEFPTEIVFGDNVFGWPLGGGDFAYDPTNFATKIRGTGVWFEGYNSSALSVAPRVYLVPAGLDVMTIPDSETLEKRTWNIVDQSIPPPFVTTDTDLNDPDFIPTIHSLDGNFGDIRKFSSLRAFPDVAGTPGPEDQMTYNSRLVGRSAANTRWLLIIPGGTFLNDGDDGLDRFIQDVTDIKLLFHTLGYSGN